MGLLNRAAPGVFKMMMGKVGAGMSKQQEAALNPKGLKQKIARTQRLVEKSVDVVHRFARELRPAALDDLGLIPALRAFVLEFSKESGIQVKVTVFADVERMNSAKRTILYRVAQEALTNVRQHAQATHVDLSIRQHSGFARMILRDDGRGFDVEKAFNGRQSKRLGLLGMRERVEMVGGTFTVESTPGNGSTLTAIIPFTPRNKGSVPQ
jgi:signal transduction histidine kinase